MSDTPRAPEINENLAHLTSDPTVATTLDVSR